MSIKAPDIPHVQSAFPSVSSIEFIDAGGFKAVYKIAISGRTEALKLIELRTTSGANEEERNREKTELRARTSREVAILGKISIPELVKLGAITLSEVAIQGNPYLAYSEELIVGSDLMKLITANGPRPDEKELRKLFLCLIRSIRALWAEGYIHRDVKPANIMKTGVPGREFVLMDLGIAFATDESGITSNTVMVPATLKYIAPEMLFRGFRSTIDYRSDLYSAALTVYEYAAFSHPLIHQLEDLGTTLYNALKKAPKPLREVRKDLSQDLCSLVDQMLKKTPALRPSNLAQIISRLEVGI